MPYIETVLGELCINGTFFCLTLEDKDRSLETRGMAAKMPGQTAIPKGKYKLGITFSNRFQKDLPLLHDVPYFTGVRIHTGNDHSNTEGCILVGVKRDRDDFIYESRKTMEALMVKLEAADGMEIEVC